ncbi:alkene reductase [Agaribacter marinus]|uniref:Alkene reductase n=1 Tax=Agaribacter marinus TaxID=1431249 RepID=A0AA37SXX8_9ALTE|nr:alkene reductase [Agaribacter marinus]GLR71968.1 alkene reductase [Agaribacter marinus]
MNVFDPYQLGSLKLMNRVVMAPMTRNRAGKNGVANELMTEYYRQRASAGLIVTESSPISEEGIGYPYTPCIYNETQMHGWKNVVDAVHDQGGKIVIQLQHCGRISHPSLQKDNMPPLSPSEIKPSGSAVTYEGLQDFVSPKEMTKAEIKKAISQFGSAAKLAKDAGFDGIEVHGANGYLIDQFLRDGTNLRTDKYGGSVEKRMRFLNEVLDSVFLTWRPQQVGIRLTPENTFNSMFDSHPQKHFEYFVEQLNAKNIAYLHVLEGDMLTQEKLVDYHKLRVMFNGTYIANNGYSLNSANTSLREKHADLIAFGTPFIANPDLVHRFKHDIPLNEADHATFYGGGEKGYIDYSFSQINGGSE